MRRMWLSPGMRLIPNRVFALERPCPAASWHWWARNEGLWAKNTENAAKERGQAEVGHGVGAVVAPARVREALAAAPHDADQALEHLHSAVESDLNRPAPALVTLSDPALPVALTPLRSKGELLPEDGPWRLLRTGVSNASEKTKGAIRAGRSA